MHGNPIGRMRILSKDYFFDYLRAHLSFFTFTPDEVANLSIDAAMDSLQLLETILAVESLGIQLDEGTITNLEMLADFYPAYASAAAAGA